ncbi:hypothetical protein [Acinetobacter sp. YH12124]|uniref:Bbp19 family protein n=1 Tax=Acinetobacter sp. YH12124 TaxID=2601109 RepID=UPI0015D2997E|nr:hypothetical protein [Acinetobacter sp. YH12124]
MILIIAVLAILLLIAVVLVFHFKNQAKEMRAHANRFEQKWLDVSQELIMAKTPKSEEEPETGHFVKAKKMRPASPETYRNVFDLDYNGQRVLAHLTFMYANKSSYVRGGHDAERESCFRAGQADVLGFIYKQINRANDPDYKEEQIND